MTIQYPEIKLENTVGNYPWGKISNHLTSKLLSQISGLLGVSANELSEALLTRVIAAAGQVMRKPHGVTEAAVSLDSFAKALYDRLFTWYVNM